MSEIEQLTHEIRGFRKEFGDVTELTKLVAGHVEFIKTYRNEVETINKTLYNDKNGIVSRMKGVETVLKSKSSTYNRTTQTLTLIFMGTVTVLWIIRAVASIPS